MIAVSQTQKRVGSHLACLSSEIRRMRLQASASAHDLPPSPSCSATWASDVLQMLPTGQSAAAELQVLCRLVVAFVVEWRMRSMDPLCRVKKLQQSLHPAGQSHFPKQSAITAGLDS